MTAIGYERISKKTYYLNGGMANTRQFRKMVGGSWHYYWRWDV